MLKCLAMQSADMTRGSLAIKVLDMYRSMCTPWNCDLPAIASKDVLPVLNDVSYSMRFGQDTNHPVNLGTDAKDQSMLQPQRGLNLSYCNGEKNRIVLVFVSSTMLACLIACTCGCMRVPVRHPLKVSP